MLTRWSHFLQQSVPPIYATYFFKRYSMKLRLLSRTWSNISKLERAVLILRPSMFIVAVVKRVVPASLTAWKHKTASVQKTANGWKWQKQKNLGQIKQTKKQFSESLGCEPPLPKRLEILFFGGFQRLLPSVGYFKETGMNHRRNCQSAFGSAVKHLKLSS